MDYQEHTGEHSTTPTYATAGVFEITIYANVDPYVWYADLSQWLRGWSGGLVYDRLALGMLHWLNFIVPVTQGSDQLLS